MSFVRTMVSKSTAGRTCKNRAKGRIKAQQGQKNKGRCEMKKKNILSFVVVIIIIIPKCNGNALTRVLFLACNVQKIIIVQLYK